ncbi:unnamed protein product [Anisakis simplex]|uniref:Acyl-CoA_dh_N domain-containing protein n=1 Tax=Anisakis simplex TaxID=6269 RepID=A0A0M3JA46_ANISI|nr:unnamed protein product [Anisakis simplex]
MLRQALLRGAQCGRCMAKNASCKSLMNRQFSHLPWFPSFRSSNPFRNLERQIREVEDYFDQAFPMSRGWAGEFCPRRMRDHPVLAEFYRIQNPIVEENGVKKFMLEFDVRRFKPEEVSLSHLHYSFIESS